MQKVAMAGVLALSASVLAACGEAPEKDGESKASDFKPCMVSDEGGFDDKSFNEISHEGLLNAAKAIGAKETSVESNSSNDYAPNLASLAAKGCDVVAAVGFDLAAATTEAAAANPDIHYILIDEAIEGENTKSLRYDTAQAAFLAGYAAADYSKTGKVGTYGGANYPSVSVFMDGFAQGVEHYNKVKNKDVKVIGWDRKKQDGLFTGSFSPDEKATNTARQVFEQGADVVLPVGGPIYRGAVTVLSEGQYKGGTIIGVDSDLFKKDSEAAPYVLTSILKSLDLSTEQAIVAASKGEFDNTPYIGTLENEGVGLAEFHDFASKVSDTLTGELDEIKAQIIDGSLKVTSYLADSK
ncbi:BMP family lipoprotein [Nocardioides yefusunii]|uniref:BMP family protein n=1 Tax=Nocardioides yefusunii TaxID=2500546 RepID=A0ABW1R0J7_9ACTN|nr:BMP family ABC transporter substrate-binding protein [Nocardioides yefusunii]